MGMYDPSEESTWQEICHKAAATHERHRAELLNELLVEFVAWESMDSQTIARCPSRFSSVSDLIQASLVRKRANQNR